jgi:hypothetical protein
MKFAGVLDRSGNGLEMTCEFRSKGSRRFYSLEQMEEVYDTLLVGGRLFVAAGYQGVKVYDVSNPAAIKYMLTKDLNDVVRGLGLYTGAGGVKHLAAVGGGSIHKGFIKVFDISSLFAANAAVVPDLVQIKTQAISDPLGGDLDSGLLNGHPRELDIVDNYAFIAVQGGGFMMVDIQRMKEYSTRESIIGYWNQDEYVTDVRAFKKTDGAGVTRFYAVLLINYYGIKILDVTDPDKPLEWGRYQVPSRRLLMGLEVAQNFWVDIDSDGRRGRDEDNDN